MPKNIYDIAVEFYEMVKAQPEAQEVLKSYDHVYQLDIKDGDPFYLEINGPELSVHRGKTSKMHDVSIIFIDRDTLMRLFEGKISPAEGYANEQWNFKARDYREGLFTLLTRIGQDIIRNEAIRKYRWE
jgi:hypothetical protein